MPIKTQISTDLDFEQNGKQQGYLPQFVVLGESLDTCCGGLGGHGASYLGPE